MLALCVESSHARGMGHLYRALNLLAFARSRGGDGVILVNDDAAALSILVRRAVPHRAVNLGDLDSGWELGVIKEFGVGIWVNDRLTTDEKHARRVKDAGLALATFDDSGGGAARADLHFAPLNFDERAPIGRKILRGTRYLVLDPAIAALRRARIGDARWIVTLGGSDTYGATVKVVSLLRRAGKTATIVTGPSFRHRRELDAVLAPGFTVLDSPPSLVTELAAHDIAVTGGGVTAFEAAALGLPTIVVANEVWEGPAAHHLQNAGASRFAGPHDALRPDAFDAALDVPAMSHAALAAVGTDGAENVYNELLAHG